MKALIDGDAIIFISASSADGRVYTCPDGSEHKYKKDALMSCDDPVLEYRPEPDSHAIHNARLLMEDALNFAGTNECVIYLKGETNFRDELFPDYKKNREGTRKPHHITTVRKWLEKNYETVTAEGMEVDDCLGIAQCAADDNTTVIISHDKDLDMIPGWHVRLKRGGEHDKYYITDEEGMYKFYCQVLTGDSTDNIKGLAKVGPKTAAKILSGHTPDEYAELVKAEYLSRGYSEKDYELCRDLIWILRQDPSYGQAQQTGKISQESA